VAGTSRVHGDTGTVDWSVVGTAWLLAFVALSRPAWEWASGALLIFSAHAVFAIHMLGVTSLSLARLAVTGYTLLVILVLFAALRPTLRTHARMAARRVRAGEPASGRTRGWPTRSMRTGARGSRCWRSRRSRCCVALPTGRWTPPTPR